MLLQLSIGCIQSVYSVIAVPEGETNSSVKLFHYGKQQYSQKDNLFQLEIKE